MDGRAEGALALKQEDHASGHWHNFPAGLRLLVVDDDPLCLKVVEQMLRKCSYEVTTCTNATMALNLLRDKSTEYDLVLSDVYMPDMDGFKLLEVVGLEMDLPVIMMSSNGDTSNVLRGVTHGACDYLIKPVRLEELRNLWQHVVRRRRQLNLDLDSDEQSQERDEDLGRNKRKADAAGFAGDQLRMMGAGPVNGSGGANGGLVGSGSVGALGANAVDELGLENGSNKKARVVWSVEMHQQFVNAVNQLGIDKAVPKKILEIMNVDGLTRENVASHLQKYRLYLKRVSGVQQMGQNRTGRPSPPQPQSPPAPMQMPHGQQPPPQQQSQMPGSMTGSGAGGPAGNGTVGAGNGGPPQSGGGAGAANGAGLGGMLGGGGGTGGNAGPSGGGGQVQVGPDGCGPSGPGMMAAAAAAAAAGAFPGHPGPPHPAALLAANPMMAAAAGLNPLLGPMGGLGLGPLGPINPLNGMPLPGMQPPLGLLSGLPGAGPQPGLGPLGPMGLPGLGALPSLPGGLPLNPMANGLQQMAAANLMQGMAAGMGQLPALAMNGLMAGLPGVGLPGPQPPLFPQPTQRQQQELQLAQNQQQQQQQAAAAAAAAAAVSSQVQQQQQQQQHQQQQQQQLSMPLPAIASPVAGGVLHQHSHPHALASPTLQAQQQQQQHQQQQQQQHHHQQQIQAQLQTQHNGHLTSGAGPMPLPTASGLNGALDSSGGRHNVHVRALNAPGRGPGSDGVLDLPAELMGGIMEDGFGAPSGGGAAPVTHVSAATAVLDPAMLLDESDNADIAAVFQEMYHSGGAVVGAGSVAEGLTGLTQGLLAPVTLDASVGLTGAAEVARMGVPDDDFLNFLLKS